MQRREIALKLMLAVVLVGGSLALLQRRGGLTGDSVPAYGESVEHAVAPMVTARIASVEVRLGDTVHAGQVLARLDDRALQLERARLEAEVRQLEAELDAQLAIHRVAVVDGVLRSSSALADENAARSESDSLKTELERVERLRAEHLVDAATENEVRRSYLAAAARVRVYESRRAQLPELYASRSHQQLTEQAEVRVRPFKEAVKARRAALDALDFQLTQYELRAPVDGTVSLLVHPVGDVVSPGLEVLRVVRGRPGLIVATVPEERARGLTPGLQVEVRTSRGLSSERRSGTVVEVGPAVEQLPERSWLSPQWPRWGRRAVIQVEGGGEVRAGERLYVRL